MADLRQFERVAIRLLPCPATKPLPLDASKIGGMILWPKAEPWPATRNWKHTPVLQIRKDDVPEVPFPAGMDLLQILWPPKFEALQKGYDRYNNHLVTATVKWRRLVPEALCLTDLPYGIDADSGLTPVECALQPQRVVEYPTSMDDVFGHDFDWNSLPVPPAYRQHNPNFRVFWDAHLSAAPGTKLMGWGQWLQDGQFHPHCPQCNRKTRLLASIASLEFDDAGDLRWGAPYLSLPPSKQKRPLHDYTGLQIAGSGVVYVHYCPTCPSRATVSTMQFT